MALMDAPAYNEQREKRTILRNIAIGVSIALLIVLFFLGYLLGHGWLFTNLPAEHKVSTFFTALEQKDYSKAYGIYEGDANWQQHPDKFKEYPLARFTEDWTTESPAKGPITSHHVDISRTDGTGFWGTGIVVASRVNLQDGTPKAKFGQMHSTLPGHKVFLYVNRADGTLSDTPHILQYAEEY